MFLSLIAFALVIQTQANSPQARMQTARELAAQQRQAAIRIDELAQQIHSEADAQTFVSQIAEAFADWLSPAWAVSGVRQRVAHAEYASVNGHLLSEEHIADVWNEYVREIGASDEALVTVPELHNLRDAEFTTAEMLWSRDAKTLWTMPHVYTLESDGKVAGGSRAIEALRLIYDLYNFGNLRAARDRMRRGVVASEEVKISPGNQSRASKGAVRFEAASDDNPNRIAERHYIQEHGTAAYEQLLQRLFDEIFPDQ